MDLEFDDQSLDHAASAAKAGARFKPKGRPQPKKKQVSLSTSQTTQMEDPASLDEASPSKTFVTDSETINQSTCGPLSEENVDVFSGGVNLSTEPSIIRACTNVDLEGKRCDDVIEAESVFPNNPRTHDSTIVGDLVTPEMDADVHAQTGRMQPEGECHLDMETLDIVQEEGTTCAFAQPTEKFQPKPRLLDTVVEEPESHYSVEDSGYFSMGTDETVLMLNVPEVPRETVPEMEAQNTSGRWEQEEQVVSPSTSNTVTGEEEESGRESKMGKPKRATVRRRKTTSEEEPNKSSENPQKKKFKHSSRRQSKRTLEKELLETPDDEIRFLPIRDMLRLVEYSDWMEKKEAKGVDVVPPTQESNMNASENQYYSQGFGGEDEFGIEEGENQERNVVKPDSPVNYQTYMNKSSRTRWSKQDTELFYEGIREFGSNLAMVQQLFPNRTERQIKLKFKLEERRYPLKVDDALSSRSKHHTHFQNVIKKLQQDAAAAAREEEEEEEEEGGREEEEGGGGEGEATADVTENEEQTKCEETERGVKEWEGGDECEDDDFWNSYKSDL